MSSSNSSYTLVFLLVLALAMVIHSSFVASKQDLLPKFTRWHVYVVNGLSNSETLFLHCKSKDDDLGARNLSAGTNFTWSFQQNWFRTTLFWCYMSKKDNAHVAFKVFWQDVLLFHMCSWKNCIWTAKDDGIYIRNFATNSDEFHGEWKPGLLQG